MWPLRVTAATGGDRSRLFEQVVCHVGGICEFFLSVNSHRKQLNLQLKLLFPGFAQDAEILWAMTKMSFDSEQAHARTGLGHDSSGMSHAKKAFLGASREAPSRNA